MATSHRHPRPAAHRRARRRPRLLAWAVVGVTAVCTGAVVVGVITVPGLRAGSVDGGLAAGADEVAAVIAAQASPPRPQPVDRPRPWYAVLADLDSARERAWRRSDPGLLADVYVEGSLALRRDRAMLRAYRDRGLSVEGVTVDVHRLGVLRRTDTSVRLRVVDELRQARVTTTDGRERLLPDDRPSTHVIDLVRRGDAWRISRIAEAQPRPARRSWGG